MPRARGMVWPAEECPSKLGLDEACLKVYSKVDYPVHLYEQEGECYDSGCNLMPWKVIPPGKNVSLLINSAYELYIFHTDKTHQISCGEPYKFSEHMTYSWNMTGKCPRITPAPRVDMGYWLPVVLAPFIILFGFLLWMGAKRVYRSRCVPAFQSSNVPFSAIENDLNIQPESNERQASPVAVASTRRQGSRISSLDAFRGICIAMMIFVNYGGGEYKIFRHSTWHGLTFADVIFPWFLWVMGVSLVVSLRSQFRNGRSRIGVWLLVARRSLILICLGLVLNSVNGINALLTYRIPGVLQRFGLAYFIIASVETCFMNLGGPHQARLCEDIIYGWIQNLVASLLALAWLIVTFLVDVPDCSQGYLGPGGLSKHGSFENCTGGAAGYIDRLIFTPEHIYQHPTCKKIFMTKQPYDPEGLLGTLTAALLVHFGAQAGRILFCYTSIRGRIVRWILWGVLMCMCAGILCKFQLGNEGYIPINKNLFSLSFVLLTGGAAFIILAILYLLIDYDDFWDGTPFRYAGMNAILLYVGHEMVRGMFPWSWKPIWDTHIELLIMNLWGTSLWLVTAYVLWQKNIFPTV